MDGDEDENRGGILVPVGRWIRIASKQASRRCRDQRKEGGSGTEGVRFWRFAKRAKAGTAFQVTSRSKSSSPVDSKWDGCMESLLPK